MNALWCTVTSKRIWCSAACSWRHAYVHRVVWLQQPRVIWQQFQLRLVHECQQPRQAWCTACINREALGCTHCTQCYSYYSAEGFGSRAPRPHCTLVIRGRERAGTWPFMGATWWSLTATAGLCFAHCVQASRGLVSNVGSQRITTSATSCRAPAMLAHENKQSDPPHPGLGGGASCRSCMCCCKCMALWVHAGRPPECDHYCLAHTAWSRALGRVLGPLLAASCRRWHS